MKTMVFLAVINLMSVFICCYDKFMAQQGGRRISEKTLFGLSLIGGAVGMYITMRIIRHKTLHKRFMIGLPVIIILQIAAIVYIFVDSGFVLS